jgi:hypothetical protein
MEKDERAVHVERMGEKEMLKYRNHVERLDIDVRMILI